MYVTVLKKPFVWEEYHEVLVKETNESMNKCTGRRKINVESCAKTTETNEIYILYKNMEVQSCHSY